MVISTENLYNEVSALLDDNREVSFRAIGNSMLPFIRGGGDVVHMVKPDKLSRGDVVLARTDDAQVVLHRVMTIDGGTLTLMGDGNLCRNERCPAGSAIARLESIERNGRRIDCQSRWWRLKSRLWMTCRPFRRYLLFAMRLLHII
ncbi:MAG: S24/S26 family peptidase [Muribaculaceae bacterium]